MYSWRLSDLDTLAGLKSVLYGLGIHKRPLGWRKVSSFRGLDWSSSMLSYRHVCTLTQGSVVVQ